MKVFKTTGPIGLNAGAMVALTKEQAASREHALLATKTKGVFQVKTRIEFKAGETFGFDGDLPKNVVDQVEADKDTKKTTKTKAEQVAEAREKKEREASDAREKAEKDALEAWDKDAALREKHGDFATYMASLVKAD